MPKMKTKRAATKRFSKTGTGKIKRTRAYHGHLLEGRSKTNKNKAKKSAILHKTNEYQVSRMLIHMK